MSRPEDLQARVEAAAWRAALTDARAETSEPFESWLAASPANEAAWRDVQAPWAYFQDHATAPEMMAVRREALARASRHHRLRFGSPAAPWRALAVSLVAAVLLAGGAAAWWRTQPETYRTAMGERRNLLLADGSRVALDSNSLVKVRLRKSARDLELVRGQARFDVAHDAARPFTVRARSETVIATGTSFNVDLLGPRVLVTLIEGRVVVTHATGTLRVAPTRLKPGQQMLAAAGAPAVLVEPVSVDKTVAWEEGLLIFQDEPLSMVAQRISRYSRTPVTTQGAAGALRISGVFSAGDVTTFVDTMHRAFALEAETREDGTVVLSGPAS